MSLKERKSYGANKITRISKASTDEGIGEFWDNHDFTDLPYSAKMHALAQTAINAHQSWQFPLDKIRA